MRSFLYRTSLILASLRFRSSSIKLCDFSAFKQPFFESAASGEIDFWEFESTAVVLVGIRAIFLTNCYRFCLIPCLSDLDLIMIVSGGLWSSSSS